MGNNATVYVRLLNEATDVWRPVPARALQDGTFEILELEGGTPEDEEWEFQPHSRVICSEKLFSDGERAPVATSLV
jgi:hypothetical protein